MAQITRANATALIPEQNVQGIIKAAYADSVSLRLMRQARMSAGVSKQPVMSVLPQGGWVSEGGRKSTSSAEWANVTLTAEELAVIVPIHENVLEDADYDIWGEVTPAVASEFGRLLDLATLFGVGPTSFGVSVVEHAVAAGNVVREGASAVDIGEDLNQVMAKVEVDGFAPTAWAAPITQKSKLRGLRDDNGQPIYASSIAGGMPSTIHDVPVEWSKNGGWDEDDDTGALFVTGDWSKAIVGIRRDVTVKLLTEATLTDGAGAVVISLAEQDMVALRFVFRVGFALANPVTQANPTTATRSPFAILGAPLVVG